MVAKARARSCVVSLAGDIFTPFPQVQKGQALRVPPEESAPHHRRREREVRQPRTAERDGDATAQARSVLVSLAAPGPVSQGDRDEQAGRVRAPARGLWGGLADRRA